MFFLVVFFPYLTSRPKDYLRQVSTAILSRVLRPTDFQCDAVRSVLREVMVFNVRLYTVHKHHSSQQEKHLKHD